MRTYKIQEISKNIFSGGTPSTQNNSFWDGDIPWLSSGETCNPYITSTNRTITKAGADNSSTRLALKGDIVIASAGQGLTRGQTSFLKIDTYINQSIVAIRCNPNYVIDKYLFYNLYSRYDEMRLLSDSSSTRGSITTKMISDMNITLPSLGEQQHIVNTIGTIDDLIEKKQLEYNKSLNFLSLLFEKNESSNTTKFGDVFNSFNGGTFESKYYVSSSSNKLITIKNIDDNGFNTDNVSYLSNDKADSKFLLSVGDIVLTMTGNIGRSGIVDESNCFLNQRVLKITSMCSSYLFAYLQKYKKEIIQLGKGTAQLNLSLEDLKELKVFNSHEEISNFKKYDSLYKSLLNCKLIIKKAKQIKQLLLTKYF